MASTYVNNLRLNEMATGDQSGSWGTVTNTNLELIGQAFGWGTRAIANASTDNITIADGASDADRNMALKLTGGGQACTVTILPNTSSKVWIMENATSYTLTFTQGSGANVAILAGETKMIATDGLGSGAVVYDVLTDLNLAGTTKAAALTVAGVGTFASLDISGNVDVDGTLEADAITLNGTALGSLYSPIAGSGSIVTTGALNSGSITSGFGTINNGSSTITTTGAVATGAITAGGNITRGGTVITDGSITDTGTFTVDVAGDIILDADGTAVMFKDAGTEFGRIFNSSSDLVIKSIVSDKDMIFQGNDGGSGITALTLDMSAAGAATFNNDVTAFSDERLKSNITTIPDALSKVSEMRGVHYVRNETGKDSSGVIAQEMQKVAPELVLTAEDEMGTLSVNYGNITGYLIEAIKELKAEIEELKAR